MLPRMTMSPDMRAGDEDRDRTVSLIREAFAEGRLTNDEFQERMEQAQQARTFGELAALTTDLPAVFPPPSASTSSAVAAPADESNWRKGWGSWLGVSVIVNVIWAATWISHPSQVPYYWPIWVMGPWGAVMLIGWLSRRGR